MGRTPAGTVLVDAARRTLYTFSPDAARHATCRGSCAAVWPPLLVGVGVKPRAGSGVRAGLLGTDPYAGGRRIVTYAGWPLYTFAGDSRRGTASGQGLNANGGRWFVIRASGARVKKR